MDDRDLLRRCRDGDPEGWIALYRAHAGTVARFLRCLLRPRAEVDDLVQEVFVRVVTSVGRYRGDGRVTTWLYGIATHVARDHLRSEGRHRRRMGAVADWAAVGDPLPDVADLAIQRDLLRIAGEAIEAMSVSSRAVWVMHELEGLASGEIARSLGITSVNVRVRLFRARRQVLEAVEEAQRRGAAVGREPARGQG